MFELFSAFYDRPTLVESAEEVLAMPPAERFTESYTVLFRFMGIEDIREAGPEDLPPELVDLFEQAEFPKFLHQMQQLLDQEFKRTQQKILEQVLEDRSNAEDYLVFVVFLEKVREINSELHYLLEQEDGGDQTLEVLSQHVAFLSHFAMIASGEQTEFDEEFLRDIVRYEYYDGKRRDEEPVVDPDELDGDDIEHRIRLQGAIEAYVRLPISVSRGAELATLSRQDFADASSNGISSHAMGPTGPTSCVGGLVCRSRSNSDGVRHADSRRVSTDWLSRGWLGRCNRVLAAGVYHRRP